MDIEFESLRELYQRLIPALETKRKEMNRAGFSYIQKEDIWNYLKEKKWIKDNNLSLSEMVSDILNTDDFVIDNYFKEKLKRQKRSIILDEEFKHEFI